MKVGKPMSKRVTVRLRHRIEKASSAKQKKQRKEAKKNPQWVSRLKKDPGIPNLFPYKAQVLAEIEESKRKKQEEAQRRREVAKAQRQGTTVRGVAQGDAEDDDDDVLLDIDEDEVDDGEAMDDGDDSNPMAALLASAQARARAYAPDDGEADEDEDDENEGGDDWDGIQDIASKSHTRDPKVLPKQALADPIKAVSTLMDRMRETTDGIQRLIDYYQLPALMTASTGLTSSFLVEVARKRGRLNRGGVPNMHSAALTVLSDLNEERLQLPSVVTTTETKTISAKGKGQVTVVSKLAEPFRIEGLWGGTLPVAEAVAEEKMVVET